MSEDADVQAEQQVMGQRDIPHHRGQSPTVTSMTTTFRTLSDLSQDKRDAVAARSSYQPTAECAIVKYFIFHLNTDV